MKPLGRLLRLILLGANLFFVFLLLLSAFGAYLPPEKFSLVYLLGLAFPLFIVVNSLFALLWLVFYRKYLFISLTALLLCIVPARDYCPVNIALSSPPESAIKLLSYNVMGLGLKGKALDKHTQEIMAYLKSSGADIVCLQEVHNAKGVHDRIEAEISSYYPYIKWSVGSKNAFACFSKYPFLSEEEYMEQEGGSVTFGIVYRLRMGDGDTLTVMNCHLQSNALLYSDRMYYKNLLLEPEWQKIKNDTGLMVFKKLINAHLIRSKQADKINAFLTGRCDDKIVVCGDMNDTPLSYTYRVLTEYLKDAHTRSGNGIDFSFNRNYLYFRIDHILIGKSLRSYVCNVDRSVMTSDHYPISCYLTY